jgi:hypothetical protein
VPDVQDALFRQEQHLFAVVPISFDSYDDMILSHHQQQQPGELLTDSPTAIATDHSHAADVSYSMWLPEEQQQQQQQLLSNNWLMESELNMLGFQQQHVPHNNQVVALDTQPDTGPTNSVDFNWMQQQLPGCPAGDTAIGMSPSAAVWLAQQQQQQQQQQAALPAWLSGPDLVHSSQASPLQSSPASNEGELLCLRSNTSSFSGGIIDPTTSPVLPAGSPARLSQHQQQMMQLQHRQQHLLVAEEAALEAVDAELQMLLERRQVLQQARLQAAVVALASTGNVLSPTTAGSGVMPLLPPLEVAPQAEGLLLGSPLVASPQGPLHLCQSASPATASLVAASAVLPAPVAATSPAQQGADLAAGETLQRLMQVQQRQMELQEELLSLLPRLAM